MYIYIYTKYYKMAAIIKNVNSNLKLESAAKG